MKVLSLFDGISCGRLAFERAGIPVEKYYSSEIDKYAIQIAQKNYPDTIQVGDVTKLNYLELLDVDIVIGGSPCQDLSIAKQNREGLRGARSSLFWKFVEVLEVIRPKYFLLENVASMRNEDRDAITETLRKLYPETECIMINSALVSAQQRKRYYWTNWHVEQPQDKGVLLKDILDLSIPFDKPYTQYNPQNKKNYVQFDVSGKKHNSQQDRAFFINTQFGCLPSARANTKIKITDGNGFYRNMTLNECEALQTLPKNYTLLNSFNKSCDAIGNGWTVDVIAWILKTLKG